jgi:thiol-disulfide isomerase/thioredoxin
MRSRILFRTVVAPFLLVALLGAGPHRGLALAPGDPAPSIDARLLNGDVFKWKWTDHSVTVVNFWATWCEPCKAEMPELQKLFERRKKNGLAVVGIVMDVVPNQVAIEFGVNAGATYPLVRGTNKIEAAWEGVVVLPVTYLISKQGTIVRRYVGAAPELTQSLVRDAEALLDGRPLGPLELPPIPDAAPS